MRFTNGILISCFLGLLTMGCGESSNNASSAPEEPAATPTVTIQTPEDGQVFDAVGGTADISLTFEMADGRSDDRADCILNGSSTGLAAEGRCEFKGVAMGDHTLGVTVLAASGDAYANAEASAEVSVTVGALACSAPADCDDGNDCTLEACEGGTCTYYSSPIAGCDSSLEGLACKTDDDCGSLIEGAGSCTTAVCNGDKLCAVTALAEGDACDDGDTCTTGDSCSEGNCVAGGPADCDDGDACTTESCEAETGCVYVDVDCDDGDPCTVDSCDNGECASVAGDGSCDDDDLCTEEDTCVEGLCAGTAKDCADDDLCTFEECNEDTGECETLEAGLNCDDNNVCTVDSCTAEGSCEYANLDGQVCDDGEACTNGDVCAAGACAAGTPVSCDDGDDCNGIEICNPEDGSCNEGVAILCDDSDPCTSDACDGGFCVYTAIENCCVADADCDNSDVCDGVETCSDGFCANGVAPSCGDGNIDEACGETCDDSNNAGGDGCSATCGIEEPDCTTDQGCDDGNPCTDNECVDNKCFYNNNTTPCDDDDECTVADMCTDGLCVGAAANCDDGVACTADSCDSDSGCVNAETDALCEGQECKLVLCDALVGCVAEAGPDGGACDGDACTVAGTCQAGECVGDTVECDDGDTCTNTDCHPTLGCLYGAETNKVCDDGDSCTENDICSVSEGGAPICSGDQISGCGEEGLVCSLSGSAGTEVSCFMSIASSQQGEAAASGIQFNMVYDSAKLTLINFYDEFCVTPQICQDVSLTGPGSQTLSTGHTVTAAPSNTADWDGSGFMALVNFANGSAPFSDAYVAADGVSIVGDGSFIEARFTTVTAVTAGAPAEIMIENVDAFYTDGLDMIESFIGPVIITTPL